MLQRPNAPNRFAAVTSALSLAVLTTVCVIPVSNPAAEQRGWSPYVAEIVPARDVPAAFARPYGRAFVAEFAAVLADSADAQCLTTKGITREQVSARAGAIAERRGIYRWDRLVGTIDRAAYESYLRARIGTEAVAELEQLRNDPSVRAYVAAEEPVRDAYIVSYIFETMDRHNMIWRIKLVRGISPYSTNDRALIDADPTETAQARLKEMVASDTTGVLLRYREMTDAARKPLNDAIDNTVFLNLNMGQMLAGPDNDADGFKNDLAALCVH